MRIIYDRAEELGFGKHSSLSPGEIASRHPSYFAWLWDARVIKFYNDRDQRWFERRAASVRKRLAKARVIGAHMHDVDFDGEEFEIQQDYAGGHG